MLSRVANSIYWMSRYIERAENVARFIDVNYHIALGDDNAFIDRWSPLVYTTGDQKLFKEHFHDSSRENVVQFLAFSEDNPNSILSCVKSARENARAVRETITTPMWNHINRFYLFMKDAARSDLREIDPAAFCDTVRNASHTLVGTTYTTMSHSDAWNFLRLGHLLERADKTSRIVDVQYFLLLPRKEDIDSPLDVLRWSALLRSASALEMYRRAHGSIEPKTVAEFLLLDEDFPRSVRFCLRGAQEAVAEITGSLPRRFRIATEKLIGRLATELDYTSIDDIVDRGMHEFIDDIQERINNVGIAIHEDFFTMPKRLELN